MKTTMKRDFIFPNVPPKITLRYYMSAMRSSFAWTRSILQKSLCLCTASAVKTVASASISSAKMSEGKRIRLLAAEAAVRKAETAIYAYAAFQRA